jgi:hypothetical protein
MSSSIRDIKQNCPNVNWQIVLQLSVNYTNMEDKIVGIATVGAQATLVTDRFGDPLALKVFGSEISLIMEQDIVLLEMAQTAAACLANVTWREGSARRHLLRGQSKVSLLHLFLDLLLGWQWLGWLLYHSIVRCCQWR